MKTSTLPFVIITFIVIGLLRCNTDKTPIIDNTSECDILTASYDLNVKAIIDNTCALSGCHVNGGEGPGVYTSYDNLIPFIEDGSIALTVIERKDDPVIGMPPDWSTNGAPKDLTEEQLDLIQCWVDAGYPEN